MIRWLNVADFVDACKQPLVSRRSSNPPVFSDCMYRSIKSISNASVACEKINNTDKSLVDANLTHWSGTWNCSWIGRLFYLTRSEAVSLSIIMHHEKLPHKLMDPVQAENWKIQSKLLQINHHQQHRTPGGWTNWPFMSTVNLLHILLTSLNLQYQTKPCYIIL